MRIQKTVVNNRIIMNEHTLKYEDINSLFGELTDLHISLSEVLILTLHCILTISRFTLLRVLLLFGQKVEFTL